MKVADLSIEDLKLLLKTTIKDEMVEVLEAKRQIFEMDTLQAVKEIKGGKVKVFDKVEDMLKEIEDEI